MTGDALGDILHEVGFAGKEVGNFIGDAWDGFEDFIGGIGGIIGGIFKVI